MSKTTPPNLDPKTHIERIWPTKTVRTPPRNNPVPVDLPANPRVPSEQQLWDNVKNCLNRGDNKGAIDALLRLVPLGDSRTHVSLGYVYESMGPTAKINYDTAAEWYGRALEIDDRPDAHLALGRYHFFGLSGHKDHFRALEHLQLASPLENPEAALMLANLYHMGEAISPDLNKAKSLYEVAVQAGYPFAMIQLARILKTENRLFSALRLRIRGIVQLARLRVVNEKDPKLIGYLRR